VVSLASPNHFPMQRRSCEPGTEQIYSRHPYTMADKGSGLRNGRTVRKVVEMFDPIGRPVSDPTQAFRVVTSYFDCEGRLVRKVLGKAVIVLPEVFEDQDDVRDCAID
jgi:hypothetical protein